MSGHHMQQVRRAIAEHLGIDVTSTFKAKVSSEDGKLVALVTQSQLAIDIQVIHCKPFKEVRGRDSWAVADIKA
jgi:hypothetical protein